MDLKDIKALIDLMQKNGLTAFEMEKDGFRISLAKETALPPALSYTPIPQVAAPPAAAGLGYEWAHAPLHPATHFDQCVAAGPNGRVYCRPSLRDFLRADGGGTVVCEKKSPPAEALRSYAPPDEDS